MSLVFSRVFSAVSPRRSARTRRALSHGGPALGARVLGLLLFTAACLAGAPAAAGDTPGATDTTRRVAVELTFLKAHPGERARLVRFIEENWFAMDRIAVTQGLMHDYRVLDTGRDDGPWNVLVEVTYTDERGYAGIVDAFERIRAAHRTVTIDGKGLRDLGAIVTSKQTFTTLPQPAPPAP